MISWDIQGENQLETVAKFHLFFFLNTCKNASSYAYSLTIGREVLHLLIGVRSTLKK
jgi:hypothetical protein